MKRWAMATTAAVLVAGCGGGGSGGAGGAGGGLDPAGIDNRSSNWAGYALLTGVGAVTRVGGSWVVPSVTCGAGENRSSSNWAGVGGADFSDPLLIQAGTDHGCAGGTPTYAGWWEGFPAPSANLGEDYPVAPGDTIQLSIDGSSGLLWLLEMRSSRGWTFTTTIPFGNAGLSAEWITEAPVVTGQALPPDNLASFGRTRFFGLSANGAAPALAASDAIVMVDASDRPVAVPSAADADGFDVCFGSAACR